MNNKSKVCDICKYYYETDSEYCVSCIRYIKKYDKYYNSFDYEKFIKDEIYNIDEKIKNCLENSRMGFSKKYNIYCEIEVSKLDIIRRLLEKELSTLQNHCNYGKIDKMEMRRGNYKRI